MCIDNSYFEFEKLISGKISDAVLMLRHGFDVNTKGKNGYTALHHAAANGNHELAGLLLDYGAKIDARESQKMPGVHRFIKKNFDSSPLIIAARNGHSKTVSLLLNRGADIEARDITKAHFRFHKVI